MEELSKTMKNTIFEIIQNQIRNNNPPETKKTYDRLLASGIKKKEVMNLIAAVVSVEIFEIMKNKTEFNLPRFVKNMMNLPEFPY